MNYLLPAIKTCGVIDYVYKDICNYS